MTARSAEALRCSSWARTAGLDPIGTAGTYRAYLLVEHPLPWPRDVGQIPELAGLSQLAAAAGARLQALVAEGNQRRVIVYADDSEPGFRGYIRRRALMSDGENAVARLLEPADRAEPVERDVLVCTHGRRDICCGSLGTQLHTELSNTQLPGDVRLWRTSHTGGHRFAPTFYVFPEGTGWAFADAALVRQVLHREGDAAEVADRYRGCTGLGSQRLQALEREVLRRVGWALLDMRRQGREESGGTVSLTAWDGPNHTTWRGLVEPGRMLPVPDCGRPIEDAGKSETEWVVSALRAD